MQHHIQNSEKHFWFFNGSCYCAIKHVLNSEKNSIFPPTGCEPSL